MPAYEPAAVRPGIVHIGLGGFVEAVGKQLGAIYASGMRAALAMLAKDRRF